MSKLQIDKKGQLDSFRYKISPQNLGEHRSKINTWTFRKNTVQPYESDVVEEAVPKYPPIARKPYGNY